MAEPTSDRLHDEKPHYTSQERQTLALEMIADELLLICGQLEIIAARGCKARDGASEPPLDDVNDVPHESENGIVRGAIETFSVGLYRYTSLEDAKAQLRRSHRTTRREIQHLMGRKLG